MSMEASFGGTGMEEQQVVVAFNGDTVQTTVTKAWDAAESLKFKYQGVGGVPQFFNLDGSPFRPAKQNSSESQVSAPEARETGRGTAISESGKARSETDRAAAEASGFTTAETVYERGTKVVQLGVDNARKSRLEWERMPLTYDAAIAIRDCVVREDRQEDPTDFLSLRMTGDGRLGIPSSDSETKEEARKRAMPITPRAFTSLTARAGFGGAHYLLDECDPELRAINWNRQMKKREVAHSLEVLKVEADRSLGKSTDKAPNRPTVVLGTRKIDAEKSDAREIFRAVSTKYTALDIDKIAEAFGVAMKDLGGRGRATYDGERAKFEAIFQTNIAPEDFVAGEFFRAGISVRTDDTGGGSLIGNAMVLQNLCLNLIIVDRASQPLFRIRHMGDFDKLVAAFQAGIKKGQEKIGHFLKAWGYAVHDNVIEEARKVDEFVPMTVSEALGGFFRGILDRELVPIKGRTEDNVKHLVRMYEKDDSAATQQGFLTRAGIVNAFTRFSHEVNQDPWAEEMIEQAAGGLLWGRKEGTKPAPLPWLPEPSAK